MSRTESPSKRQAHQRVKRHRPRSCCSCRGTTRNGRRPVCRGKCNSKLITRASRYRAYAWMARMLTSSSISHQ